MEAPENGVLVHGLFCDGMRWDDETMKVTDAVKGVMNSSVPMILMLPQMDYEPEEGIYTSPLYKTAARAGVLSTTGTVDRHWTVRGREGPCLVDCGG